jgi:hypothetical protein
MDIQAGLSISYASGMVMGGLIVYGIFKFKEWMRGKNS